MIKYIKKAEITLFHQYFPEESEAEKQEMLRLVGERENTENEKKEVSAQFASKLKSIESAFKLTAENLRRNGEDRKIITELYFDFLNEKRIYKNAKGEIVRIMPFQESDYETPVPIGINEPNLQEAIEDDDQIMQILDDVIMPVRENLKSKVKAAKKELETAEEDNVILLDGEELKSRVNAVLKDLETA
jgi:hypothetical protein